MPTRLDFGRIIPGILIVLVGLGLLAVLLLVALFSFLFFFVPGSGDVLRASVDLLVVPLVLFVAGALSILSGVSWWGTGRKGWFAGVSNARAAEDRISIGGRVGEIVGVVISALILLFLYANQARGVAFFTSSFGATAEFYFYGPMITGMAISVARALYGRRNPIRPLDVIQALFLAASAFWLLSVFPLDFTHLGDMFPPSIRFIFSWIPNLLGRLLFLFAGVVSLINAAYTATLYFVVRGRLRSSPASL